MSGLPSTATLDLPIALGGGSADPADPVVAQIVEPLAPAAPSADAEKVTPDAIQRARQQEKDKLYGQISQRDERMAAMERELAELRADREAKIAAEAKAQQDVAEADRLKQIAETSAKDLVLQQQAEFERRFADLQAEREREREELAKEAEFNALRAYINEQVRTHSDDIAPQLLDLVTGNSEDEVNASIEVMKAKTAEILTSVKEAQTQQRSLMRGVAPTSIPGASPNEDTATRNLTAQDIKNMSMDDWRKHRKQLIGSSNNSTNRGLFD